MKPTQRNYRSVSFKNFLSGSILKPLLYRLCPTGHNTQHILITVTKCTWTLGNIQNVQGPWATCKTKALSVTLWLYLYTTKFSNSSK
jgi:hypothetical protein